ncbi:MAG: hypothetical protein MRZ79_06945 [Bacteroidia bacterium]|nr:hypothetical protein [Bacteroidia bacterium]
MNSYTMKILAQFPQCFNKQGFILILFSLMALAFISCNSTYSIKNRKTGKFEVGAEWPPVDDFFWKGMEVLDTVYSESGYSWGVQILSDKDGRILIEEDFFVKGIINRIRIEHPKWKSKNGIQQGQSYGEVKGYFERGRGTYLEAYEYLDLVEREGSGIHFLFKVKKPAYWEGKETIDLKVIPDSLIISSIVIM